MHKSFSSGFFWGGVRPFFLLFMTIELLTRSFLFAYDFTNMDGGLGGVASTLMTGFIFDLAVFSYFLVIVSLFLLLPHNRASRYVLAALYFVSAYAFLFNAAAEYFFWDEFSTRFNFIAVDYLVYTTEVIDNIVQSYPIFRLMGAIGVIAAALTWLYWKRQPVHVDAPAVPVRLGHVLCSVLLAFVMFCAPLSSLADNGGNRYMGEIAKNGIYELFSAFRHNELDYNQFYVTGNETKLLPLLQAELGIKSAKNHDPLARMIAHQGSARPYNVMLVTVESLSASFLGSFGNDKNLTPFLDDLAKQSLLFTNMYATGTRTVYGLSALTLSIPPLPGNSIVRRPHNEGMFSLGGVLAREGYENKFIYGGYGYFDNMNYFFAHNGYQIVDRASFSGAETTFSNAWGVADEDLYNKAIAEADKSAAKGKPFFQMLMTTSNHRPFTYPDGRIDIPSPGRRAGAVKYTDYALGQLIAQAKKHAWFDNTIFVIVADHTASSAGKEELEPDKYHIPMLVYAPGIIKPARIDQAVSQIDVAPTILGLLNLSYESRFYGRDVLAGTVRESPVLISNYQQLGYMQDNNLVILKPVKKTGYYARGPEGEFRRAQPDQKLLDEALSYYQSATNWKNWSRLN